VGDVLHVGAPHADETVVDLGAGGAYPPVRLPWEDHLERGAYVSVGAVALQAVHDAPIRLGGSVAVVGLGAVGLLTLQMARLAGAAHVVALDLSPVRRELALALGADEAHDPRLAPEGPGAAYKRAAGRGVDVALETSGSDAGLHDAVACTGLGGTVVTVGFYQGGAGRLRLGEEWHHNRLTMVSSMGAWDAPHRDHPAWTRARIMAAVVELLGSGAVRTDLLPVRRFPFEDAPDAFAWLDRHPDDALKLILAHGP
jgi:threonine dehydrogenase-like Zn-dependent dehydrogenase